jgi:hypothetical protein
MLPGRICNWSVDKHSDLTSGVHNIFADCLLSLQCIDDVLQTVHACTFTVFSFALAVILDIIVMMPSAKAFLDLHKQTIKDFVCECFHKVGLVVGALDPALHCNGTWIVLGSVSSNHGLVDASNLVAAIALDFGNG